MQAAACRPFDKERDGFVFGEAGALLTLETEEHAKACGANIIGRVMGAGITSDGYQAVRNDPSGERAANAMTRAIQLPDSARATSTTSTRTQTGRLPATALSR